MGGDEGRKWKGGQRREGERRRSNERGGKRNLRRVEEGD